MTTDGRRPLASGLTLREEFARSAMAALLAADDDVWWEPEPLAEYVVTQVDALIRELNNPDPDPEDT